MRKYLFYILLFGSIFRVSAQQSATDSVRQKFMAKKFNVHLSLGNQFSSYSGYGSALSTIVTPTFTYDLSKRLQLQGGISLLTTNYFGVRPFFSESNGPASSGNFTSALLFVSGTYLLNNNISISGSAFKEFPVSGDPLPYSPFQPYSNDGAHGIRMDINYKVGEHFQIQAGFGYSKGVNPYYSPYGNSFWGTYDRFGLMPQW